MGVLAKQVLALFAGAEETGGGKNRLANLRPGGAPGHKEHRDEENRTTETFDWIHGQR